MVLNTVERMTSMKLLMALAAVVLVFVPLHADAQSEGEQLFAAKGCVACHTIGGGRLVGPDLAGVSSLREEGWLATFLKSPQAMVAAGDPIATKLLEEYGQVMMPDLGLTDEQVQALLLYLKSRDAPVDAAPSTPEGAAANEAPKVAVEQQATEADIARGQDLFQGKIRFTNDGPSCISCHHVRNDAVIGGGILAKELTTVFSRLGAPGVRAIIGSPPFPVMQQAYLRHPLTKEEIFALISFLQHADETHALQQPFDYGVRLFAAGVVGCVLLLCLYFLVWHRRKKKSVYDAIHRRQIRSEK